MTWDEHLRRWTPIILVVVLVLVAVRSCERARHAEDEAARLVEEARARAAGLEVVERVPDLRPDLDRALAQNALLSAEIERARKALPAAKPIALVCAATEPAPAVRPVALGELLRLEVDAATMQGRAGARLVVGTVAARTAADGALVLRQPFSARLTEAIEAEREASGHRSSWRAGPLGGVLGPSWAIGALVVSPAVRVPIVGLRVGLSAAIAAGPGGAFVMAGPTF